MGTRGDTAGDSQRAIPGALLGITVMAGEKKKNNREQDKEGLGQYLSFIHVGRVVLGLPRGFGGSALLSRLHGELHVRGLFSKKSDQSFFFSQIKGDGGIPQPVFVLLGSATTV